MREREREKGKGCVSLWGEEVNGEELAGCFKSTEQFKYAERKDRMVER